MKVRRPRPASALLACLGLYALVVLASPVLHHDFDCHLKSPRHCQACVANPLAPRAAATSVAAHLTLLDLGKSDTVRHVVLATGVAPNVSGRAPPR
jgi:hypothetical protein